MTFSWHAKGFPWHCYMACHAMALSGNGLAIVMGHGALEGPWHCHSMPSHFQYKTPRQQSMTMIRQCPGTYRHGIHHGTGMIEHRGACSLTIYNAKLWRSNAMASRGLMALPRAKAAMIQMPMNLHRLPWTSARHVMVSLWTMTLP